MGSGLIYAAIIVMWALYFIPRWLRRHEELSESRSVEKFDHAMRILSRREPTPDQRYIVMPPKPEPVAPVARARSAPRSTTRPPAVGSTQRRSSQPSIALRRRRVLAALLLLTVVVTAITPITPVPWWAPLLAALAMFADLAHLRVQERRRRELTRTRDAVRTRLRSRLHRVDSAERLAEARALLAERRAVAETERLEAERVAHESDRRAAERAAGWQPTPVPLPTYVTKPVAPRVGRAIDLTQPGAWTEAQGLGASASPLAAASPEEIFDQTSAPPSSAGTTAAAAQSTSAQSTSGTAPSYDDYAAELDEILERRRAVND